MCVHDPADKEAVGARFLRDFPHATGHDHPALHGVAEIAWPDLPGCPVGVPAVFSGLLDEAAGQEALRVLGIVLTDGVFQLSAAMPAALPFLIKLAADPDAPVRARLVEFLIVVAELAQAVDEPGGERMALLFGHDADHPERAECRSVFVEHAAAVRALVDDTTLPDDVLDPVERDALLKIAAPH